MNPTAMFIAALLVLPAFGLVTWVWLSMAQVEDDLRAFSGLDGLNFETRPQTAQITEGTKWPIPG